MYQNYKENTGGLSRKVTVAYKKMIKLLGYVLVYKTIF